jgi:membrane fusion protein, multidrug efflux system
VMVVGAKDVVESRPIQVGELEGDSWVVQGGLQPGERVIVDGLQKAMPGKPVKAVVASATPPATPPGPAPAGAQR